MIRRAPPAPAAGSKPLYPAKGQGHRMRAAPLLAVLLLAVAPGCVRPDADGNEPAPTLVAFLGGATTYEAPWEPDEVAAAFEGLGFSIAWQSNTAVGTPYSTNLSMRAERLDATHWMVHVERTFWRVEACSEAELAAWKEEARAAVDPDVERLLLQFEGATGAARVSGIEATEAIRNSDGSVPLVFPSRCPGGDGVTVVRVD